MARDLSTAAVKAVLAQQTDEVFVFLLQVDHPSFVAPIRVCNNNEDVTSGGFEFLRFPFEITLPDDSESAPPAVKLRIANADREIVNAVRSISGEPATVTLSIVMASSPNTIEAGPLVFKLRDVEYNASEVTGTLKFEDILNEPYPADTYSPTRYPSLF